MYRNAFWDSKKKQIMLSTWSKDGERIRIPCNYTPYLYIEAENGEATSIFEQKITRKNFRTPFDRSKFIKTSGIKRIYENFDPSQQFLIDCFWKYVDNPNFSKYDLRIIFFDIEVDPIQGGEFPKPEEAKAEINILTAWDSLDNKYYVFSKNNYTGNNLPENVVFFDCKTERSLLEHFILFWQHNDYPDIVSGWNSNGFDYPYLFNRIIKVLGTESFESLSPYGSVNIRTAKDKMLRDVVKYDIGGVTLVDTIDVYINFSDRKMESYKLDFIGNEELGIGKVDYNGMTIYEFMKKDWNRFVEYNIQDVKLLVDLEKKLRHFQILRMVANYGCVNYDKALMTIPVTNGAVAVRCRQRDRKLNTFERVIDWSTKKPGGYVSSNPGLHKDIVNVDANSLYPSLIRSNNISPETKIGMVYFMTGDVYEGSDDDEAKLVLTNGRSYELKRHQVQALIRQKDLILSANGCLFSQKIEGVLPQFMREVYTKRDDDKKNMKRIVKENKELEDELKKLREKLKSL